MKNVVMLVMLWYIIIVDILLMYITKALVFMLVDIIITEGWK